MNAECEIDQLMWTSHESTGPLITTSPIAIREKRKEIFSQISAVGGMSKDNEAMQAVRQTTSKSCSHQVKEHK